MMGIKAKRHAVINKCLEQESDYKKYMQNCAYDEVI